MQGAWQVDIAALVEGSHTFDVVATDAAGNSSGFSVDVLVDLGPPVVTITSPASAALFP